MITILPIDPIFAITTISSIDAIFTIYYGVLSQVHGGAAPPM